MKVIRQLLLRHKSRKFLSKRTDGQSTREFKANQRKEIRNRDTLLREEISMQNLRFKHYLKIEAYYENLASRNKNSLISLEDLGLPMEIKPYCNKLKLPDLPRPTSSTTNIKLRYTALLFFLAFLTTLQIYYQIGKKYKNGKKCLLGNFVLKDMEACTDKYPILVLLIFGEERETMLWWKYCKSIYLLLRIFLITYSTPTITSGILRYSEISQFCTTHPSSAAKISDLGGLGGRIAIICRPLLPHTEGENPSELNIQEYNGNLNLYSLIQFINTNLSTC